MMMLTWAWAARSNSFTWTRSDGVHGVVEFLASASVVTPRARRPARPGANAQGAGALASWPARGNPGAATAERTIVPELAMAAIFPVELRSTRRRRSLG